MSPPSIYDKTSGPGWQYGTATPHELAYSQYSKQIGELLAGEVANAVLGPIQIDGEDRMIPRLIYPEIGLTL